MLENVTPLGSSSKGKTSLAKRRSPSASTAAPQTARGEPMPVAFSPVQYRKANQPARAGSTPRPIGNNKVIILDPFFFNLPDGVPAWEGFEQLFNGACGDFDVDTYTFTDATLDAYKTMSEYGIVVLMGHSWTNLTFTGEEATPDRRMHNMRDLRTQRAGVIEYRPNILGGDPFSDVVNLFFFRPSFVTGYATRDGYPNSVVAAASCHSANGAMRPAFIASGVNSLIAHEQYGHSELLTEVAYNVLSKWLYVPGVDIESAFAAAYPNGRCDAQDPNYPDFYFGCAQLILHPSKAGALLPPDEFFNGSFEQGDFSGWREGGSYPPYPRVMRQFGPFLPTKGKYMARIDLAANTLHFGGFIEQTICLRGRRLESISFDFNFVMPNLPQVCGTPLPFIEVRPSTDRTPALAGFQYVDNLYCASAVPTALACSDFVRDGLPAGCTGVWATGWQSTTISLADDPYQANAQFVKLSIAVDADRGGVAYDFRTAALIDNIRLKFVPDEDPAVEVDRALSADVYSNGGVELPDAGPATPYSSVIEVAGIGGGGGGDRGASGTSIESMRVGIQGLSHTFPDDLDLL
ncbi:MAG: hypothetical protein IT364_13410, partial [Candidatus Hydrogenedentes bacterium]|nr:hypothetical protein [Candidatus Hydrogenedentota bacterium]